jgi:apolipoprotein N-acyltransferase
MLAFTFFYGWHKLVVPENAKQLRVALVQANVLTRDNMPVVDQEKHLRAYEGLTREAAVSRPNLIVWPASSLPAPIRYSRLVNFNVRRLAIETKSYLLVGGAGMEKFGPLREGFLPFSNSEFLIAPSGRIVEQYDKIRLTPFNEYLPLQGRIRWPKWITTLKESFAPGEGYTLFQVSEAKFGTPICWENMFPDLFSRFVRDGAQFMVSVTNEGFFGCTAAPYQSFAINIFRAVENRVAIVRSATTGISAFISPNGEIIERVQNNNGKDLFVSGFLVKDIPLSNHKTFYTVYGDIFAYVAIVFGVFMIAASLLKQKRSRSQPRI